MAYTPFTLQVTTVSESLFDGEAHELHCRGVDGQLTILAHHEPLITRLEAGDVKVVAASGEEHVYAIHSGVVEVADNKAVVLCSMDEQGISTDS